MNVKELEGLTYTEFINLNNALKILQNWNDILENLPDNRKKKIKEQQKTFDPLIHLKKICKDKSEIIHTTYNFSKSLKTYGRLFAQNTSLQGLPREIRNALAFGRYYDIDMKNAHPSLLSQYCNFNGIRCEIVDEYVRDRDAILKKICEENHMDRCDAKNVVLSILNGGKCDNITGDFIDRFKNEIKLIHKQICFLNPEEMKKVKSRKEYNQEGSMVNIILCKLEHFILMNAVSYMKSLGFNVDVLVFDGFMVRKEDIEVNETILKDLQQYIIEKTKYDITFEEKSLNHLIDLSKYVEPLMEEQPEVTYYKDKENFEKNHMKITHSLMYITILEDGSMDYQTEEKIVGSYKHLKSTILDDKGKVQKVSFIKTWINDEHIRLYRRMVFSPPPIVYDNKDYNTWREFEQEKITLPTNFDVNTNEYVLKYKQFIYNLFDGVEDYINFYDAWCANIIQNPAKRSCICLVLYSLFEGVGKNMSTRTLELCVGENYTFYISDVANQLFGKHSSAELNRLLIVLNEVKGKDTYSNTDLFKTRITDTKREIELKGKDAFQTNNYCSYILNTNNINAVNAGDKDRRFCVIPCVNKKIDDKKYFDDYERTINNNPEAIRCIYQYLKTFDIDKYVPNRIFSDARPKSELYKELQDCNKDKEWDMLEELVRENFNTSLYILNMDSLWVYYKNFCHKHNYDFSKLPSKRFHYLFSQNIIAYLNNKSDTKDAITKGRTKLAYNYQFDIQKLKVYFKMNDTDNE